MVVVTGTKRSGTSLWMQILIHGGLEHIGEAFPHKWSESIVEANPKGFYESRLRTGIFYATNPDPRTGAYLRHQDTKKHAVKVFIPGVVRTEIAYLHRVVATLRDWRSYSRSIDALYAKEDAWLFDNPGDGRTGEQAVASAQAKRPGVPAPIEWFLENYDLVRDFAVRRYPISFVSYDTLLTDPEPVVSRVLEWVGQGNVRAAMDAIDPELRRSQQREAVASEAVVDPAAERVFDDFYDAIHSSGRLPRTLLPELNELWTRLQKEFGGLSRERGRSEDEAAEAP